MWHQERPRSLPDLHTVVCTTLDITSIPSWSQNGNHAFRDTPPLDNCPHTTLLRGRKMLSLFLLHDFVITNKTFPRRPWADFHLHFVNDNFYHMPIPVLIIGKGHNITVIALHCYSPTGVMDWAQFLSTWESKGNDHQVGCVCLQSVLLSFEIATLGKRLTPELKFCIFRHYCYGLTPTLVSISFH